jgi:hypothetical protein
MNANVALKGIEEIPSGFIKFPVGFSKPALQLLNQSLIITAIARHEVIGKNGEVCVYYRADVARKISLTWMTKHANLVIFQNSGDGSLFDALEQNIDKSHTFNDNFTKDEVVKYNATLSANKRYNVGDKKPSLLINNAPKTPFENIKGCEKFAEIYGRIHENVSITVNEETKLYTVLQIGLEPITDEDGNVIIDGFGQTKQSAIKQLKDFLDERNRFFEEDFSNNNDWQEEQEFFDDYDWRNKGCGEYYSCSECSNYGCPAHPCN